RTNRLYIAWRNDSLIDIPNPSLDDAILFHLARSTKYLDMSSVIGMYTTRGIEQVYKAFLSTDLLEVKLSTPLEN
ncbi:hypothetical protein PFISCL1PPCAC_17053, partial [Pristionchus fissidentatus]